ncbi:MAG: hypothetical protein RLZZ609_2474 [Cyanobacteriota bacterium]|jgi:hypothetical protein
MAPINAPTMPAEHRASRLRSIASRWAECSAVCGAYGPLSSVHIRVAGPWMLPQLQCVGEKHAPGAGFGYMLVASILAQLAGVFLVLARPLLASRLLAGLSAFLARLPAGGIGGAHAGDGELARGLECWGPG